MDNEKTDKIEIALAHHEQQIQDLSDMLNLQRKEIDQLKKRLEITQGKLAEVELSVSDKRDGLSTVEQAALDKPPHY